MKSTPLLSLRNLLSLGALVLVIPLRAKPLQIYILAGQSNMQGHAKVTTFEHIGMDPATKLILSDIQKKSKDRAILKATKEKETGSLLFPIEP